MLSMKDGETTPFTPEKRVTISLTKKHSGFPPQDTRMTRWFTPKTGATSGLWINGPESSVGLMGSELAPKQNTSSLGPRRPSMAANCRRWGKILSPRPKHWIQISWRVSLTQPDKHNTHWLHNENNSHLEMESHNREGRPRSADHNCHRASFTKIRVRPPLCLWHHRTDVQQMD